MKKIRLLALLVILAISTLNVLPAQALDIKPEVQPRIQWSPWTYGGYGDLVKIDSDHVMYIYRQSTTGIEVTYGWIVRRTYTISTGTWGPETTIYADANPVYDSRDVCTGVINGRIYAFFGVMDISVGPPDLVSNVYSGYVRSTDITGTTWESFVPLWTKTDFGVHGGVNFYSKIVPTSVAGTYLITDYNNLTPGTISVNLWRTTDYGSTWAPFSTIITTPDVIPTNWSETALAYIGSRKLVALLRQGSNLTMSQSVSSDDGSTWSAIQQTNLGSTGGPNSAKVPTLVYDPDNDLLVTVINDRGASPSATMIVGIGSAPTVFSDPLAWQTEIPWVNTWDFALRSPSDSDPGYYGLEKIGTNKYMTVGISSDGANQQTYGQVFDLTPNTAAWWNTSWLYRSKFTVNAYQITNQVTQSTTNFTAEIVLDSTNFDFSRAKSDGGDIRFFSDAAGVIALDYQLSSHNATAQIARYYVNLPTLNSTTAFYMYYGNPAATTSSGTAVWTDAQAIAAWNMNEGTGTTLADVTGNGNTGTFASTNVTWEQIGNKWWILTNGAADSYVTVADSPTLSALTPITIFAGVKTTTGGKAIVSKTTVDDNDKEWTLRATADGSTKLEFNYYGGNGADRIEAGGTGYSITDNATHWVSVSWNGTNADGSMYLMRDANEESATGSKVGVGAIARDAGQDVEIGRDYSDPGEVWNGYLTDIRIYNRLLNYSDRAWLQYSKTYAKLFQIIQHDTQLAVTTGSTTGVSMTKDGLTSGTFYGNATDLGGSSNTTKWLDFGTTASYGYWTTPVNTAGTGNFTGSFPSNLTPGATYYYRSVAQNDIELGYGSVATVDLTMPTPVTSAISDLTHTTSTSAVLNGSLSSLGVASSAYVKFEWGYDTSYGHSTPLVSVNATGPLTATITGFSWGRTLHTRVVVSVGSTSAYGSDVSTDVPYYIAPLVGFSIAILITPILILIMVLLALSSFLWRASHKSVGISKLRDIAFAMLSLLGGVALIAKLLDSLLPLLYGS